MRIDIGPEGEVLATKKITSNGTISGLKAHAGKEVIIVASHGPPTYRSTPRDRLDSAARAIRQKTEELQLKAAAEGGPVQMIRQRAPLMAVKAMDQAKVGLDRTRAWVDETRQAMEERARDARAKAEAARARVETTAEGAKDDLESRARKLRQTVEAGAARRRQDIETRVASIRREVEARWDAGRRQVGDRAQRLRQRVAAQAPQSPDDRRDKAEAPAPGVN